MVIKLEKNIGIVAEYNPFHNGHTYHLNKSKELLNSTNSICIMSGNFIQRGLPALYNKWVRTQMALDNGIDLVIELPTYYSINSAQHFAKFSIELLNSLNCISHICFGTECNDIQKLDTIANITLSEPKEYTDELKIQLNKGVTFAKASELSILKTLKDNEYSNILQSPNNILGIEYIKALKELNSSIVPVSIKRDNDYLTTQITSDICSATAIRELLENSKENVDEHLKKVVPTSTYDLITTNKPTFLSDFGREIIYSIRKMSLFELENVLEVTEGLEKRLKKYAFETDDIYTLIQLVKTKRFTQTKIQRILIHILLNMTKAEFESICNNSCMYIRVLGFNSKGKNILKELSKGSSIPIITSVKKYIDTYGQNPLLQKDILSSDIYCGKYNIDYTQKIIQKE